VPLYEYECRSCGTVTDIRHGFDESVTEACPACGGELTRRFSPTGIVFKGSGFYITDSRKSGGTSGKSRSSSEKAAAEAGTPKQDAAAPAKPDAAGAPAKSEGSGPAKGESSKKGDSSAA
jgi:putative FmdB family regulatory protein